MAITDNFNRASLGSGWEAAGGTIWTIVSSTHAKPADTSGATSIRRTEASFPDDQYAQSKLETFSSPDNGVQQFPGVRMDGSGNGYYGHLESDGNLYLYKRVAGTPSIIGSGYHGGSFTTGTYYTGKVSATGTTIKMFVEGVERISVTDSTFTSGKPGLTATGVGDASKISRFDDFECTYAEAGPPSPPTLSSVEIQGNGNFVLTYSEAVTGTEKLGYSVTTTGSAITFSSGSGSGTAIHTLVPSRVPEWTEVITVDYAEATGNLAGIEADLEDIADFEVVNYSDSFQPALPTITGWRTGSIPRTLPTGWDGTADISPANSAAFQAALDGAVQNAGIYIIELTAGVTYTGPFKVNAKAGSDWLFIRTSDWADLPAAGTRVSSADAASMAVISCGGTGASGMAIWHEWGSHHIHYLGLEIKTTYSSQAGSSNQLICCGYDPDTNSQPTDIADQSSYITFERCYIHGTTNGNNRQGIVFDCSYGAIIDCDFRDFHEVGADSQAIAIIQGAGPFYIDNNRLEGAGENFISGGADPQIADMVPADITFTNNYVTKPLTWMSGHGTYAGNYWTVKNSFELKNARRVLVEGNIFERHWGNQGQSGYSMVLTVRNQDGSADWSAVEDVTVRKNIIRDVFAGFNIPSEDSNYPSENTKRILIEDNLIVLNSEMIADSSGTGRYFACLVSGEQLAEYVAIRHNTCLSNPSGTINFLSFGDTPPYTDNFKFKDNITHQGTYGVHSPQGSGITALATYCEQYEFLANTIILDGESALSYPSGNDVVADYAAVEFTDSDGGDYSLDPDSDFASGGSDPASDGEDRGVDWDALQAAIEDTESGGVEEEDSDSSSPFGPAYEPAFTTSVTFNLTFYILKRRRRNGRE